MIDDRRPIECIMCGSSDTGEYAGEFDEPDVLECFSCGFTEVL